MKPIAFSRPMVLSRHSGRKTQTRRLVKPQPTRLQDTANVWNRHYEQTGCPVVAEPGHVERPIFCPYGYPGDRLWVREDFQFVAIPEVPQPTAAFEVRYLADQQLQMVNLTAHEQQLLFARQFPQRATPGRFMYQSLARDKPTLLAVRVERLQDITEADAIAEGCYRMDNGLFAGPPNPEGSPGGFHTAKGAFDALWGSIHGPESWAANPYVWVLTLSKFQTA